MATLYEQTEYRGHHIRIYYDSTQESPRDWDNLGTFYTAHRNHKPEEDFNKHFEYSEVFASEGVFCKCFLKKYIALPIYLYDHSGYAISSVPFSCKWDSCLFGMVATSIEKVKREYGWKILTSARRKSIEQCLQQEIDTYNKYLQGEVYGYQIVDNEEDVIESCWGFYGDDGLDEIREECPVLVDFHICQQEEQEREELLRTLGPELPFPELAVSVI